MTNTTYSSNTSHSPEESRGIAAAFARQLTGGERIILIGDLGAGKTTFTQGLVAALGSTARVKSPTFTVMNEYPVIGHSTIHRVVHCDMYRFTAPEELRALELEEYQFPDTVIIIEWPDALPTVDWRPTYIVRIGHIDEHSRSIVIEEVGE